MAEPPLLLFPQTLPYPSRVEKALEELESILVLELPYINENWQKHWAKFLNKVKFLKLKPEASIDFDHLKRLFLQLKDWALYLRDVENLKILERYAKSEDDLPFFAEKKKETLGNLERAYLVLMLAEDVDLTLSEVKKSLNTFEQTWEDFFKEGIVGEDPFFRRFEVPWEKGTLPEELSNLSKRVFAWNTIFPHLDLEEFESIKLLVSEAECVELLKETKIMKHPKINGIITLF